MILRTDVRVFVPARSFHPAGTKASYGGSHHPLDLCVLSVRLEDDGHIGLSAVSPEPAVLAVKPRLEDAFGCRNGLGSKMEGPQRTEEGPAA